MNFDLKKEIPGLENAIIQKYQNPQNMYDRLVSTYIGIMIGVRLNDDYDKIKVKFDERM